MPSLKRMNSTLPSAVSQSGNKVRIRRSAEACESALLCDRGNVGYPGSPLRSGACWDMISDQTGLDCIEFRTIPC